MLKEIKINNYYKVYNKDNDKKIPNNGSIIYIFSKVQIAEKVKVGFKSHQKVVKYTLEEGLDSIEIENEEDEYRNYFSLDSVFANSLSLIDNYLTYKEYSPIPELDILIKNSIKISGI